VIIDTGVLFAVYHSRDRHHKAAAELIQQAHKDRERLWLLSPVLAELHWVARKLERSDEIVAQALKDVVAGAWDLIDLTTVDVSRIGVLLVQYADSRLDFVDAACVAVAERLEETTVATVDRRDFTIVRPAHVPALHLVPEL
jgi:uncharacterized protein